MNNSVSPLHTKISANINLERVRTIDISELHHILMILIHKMIRNQLPTFNHGNKSVQLDNIFKYKDSYKQNIDKLINYTNILNENNTEMYEYNVKSRNFMQFIEIVFIFLIILFLILLRIFHK